MKRNAYTPYGATRGVSPATSDQLPISKGWLNQISDGNTAAGGTGLVYLNARYYNPLTSRFMSPDPLMNPMDPKTLDPYRYADNNPVVFMDATGLAASCGSLSGAAWDMCNGYASGVYDTNTGETTVHHNYNNARTSNSPGGQSPALPAAWNGPYAGGNPWMFNAPGSQSIAGYSITGIGGAGAVYEAAHDADGWLYQHSYERSGGRSWNPNAGPLESRIRSQFPGTSANHALRGTTALRSLSKLAEMTGPIGDAVDAYMTFEESQDIYELMDERDRFLMAVARTSNHAAWSAFGAILGGIAGFAICGPACAVLGTIVGGGGAGYVSNAAFDSTHIELVDSLITHKYADEGIVIDENHQAWNGENRVCTAYTG